MNNANVNSFYINHYSLTVMAGSSHLRVKKTKR